jgi:hypothetical protein
VRLSFFPLDIVDGWTGSEMNRELDGGTPVVIFAFARRLQRESKWLSGSRLDVRITNGASDRVCYPRIHDHNRMRIADGSEFNTKFDIPKSCEIADGALEIVTNRIASAAVAATVR